MSTWPKERQEDAFRRHSRHAYKDILQWLVDHEEDVLAEAEARMLGLGFDQYGDASFQLTPEELEQGKKEEGADMLVYQVIIRAKERVARGAAVRRGDR